MSRLHPTARELIAAAKRQERGLPLEARERVHGSVLRRAALGTAVTSVAATSATNAAAKTGVAALLAGHPFVAGGLAIVVASGSGLAIGKTWRAIVDSSAPAEAPSATPVQAPRHVTVAATPDATRASTREAIATASAPAMAAPPLVATVAAAPTAGGAVVPQASPARWSGTTMAPAASDPSSLPVVPVLATSPALAPSASGVSSATAANPVASAYPWSAKGAAAAPDPLSIQLPILHRVREALRAHRPSQALALLDENASVLRSGPLVEETELARVSALCQLGSRGDAQGAIERFIARWPGSSLAVALQGGCPSENLPTGEPVDRHGSR